MSETAKPPLASSGHTVINIAIVENDPLRFVGFRAILESEADFRVHASNPRSIVEDVGSDVVILGSRKPAATTEMITALKAVRPDVRVIVTGPGSGEDDILRAISAGAKGYLDEAASPEHFKQAIRVVHSGSVWAPRHVLSRFIEKATSGSRKREVESSVAFTERERQVLRLLVDGHTNREIGERLGIEERTVKAYVAKLMHKVGVNNRIALSVHALTNALLDSSD